MLSSCRYIFGNDQAILRAARQTARLCLTNGAIEVPRPCHDRRDHVTCDAETLPSAPDVEAWRSGSNGMAAQAVGGTV